MRWLRGLAALIGYLCAATLLAQLVGLIVLASRLSWDAPRRERFVAAVYGLGLPAPEPTSEPATVASPEQELFQQRVASEPWLRQRQKVFAVEVAGGKQLTESVKIERDEENVSRKSLQDFLAEAKGQAEVQGQTALRTTLEVLPAKQAKEILIEMLGESPESVISLVKVMPLERTKKIFAEFKTPEEADQLHRILLELGDLASQPVPNQPDG